MIWVKNLRKVLFRNDLTPRIIYNKNVPHHGVSNKLFVFETDDNPAIYRFTGDKLYVRAKIISDRKHPNPFAEGDLETAWTQLVTVSPGR